MPSGALAVSVRCAGVAPLTSDHWTLDNACVLSPLEFPPLGAHWDRMWCQCSLGAGGARSPPRLASVSEKRHVCHKYLRGTGEIR